MRQQLQRRRIGAGQRDLRQRCSQRAALEIPAGVGWRWALCSAIVVISKVAGPSVAGTVVLVVAAEQNGNERAIETVGTQPDRPPVAAWHVSGRDHCP